MRQKILLKYKSQVRGGALLVLIEAKDNVDGRCALNLLLQFLPCYSSTLNNKRTKKYPFPAPHESPPTYHISRLPSSTSTSTTVYQSTPGIILFVRTNWIPKILSITGHHSSYLRNP